MKKLLTLAIVIGFLFVGCQDDSSVLEPNFDNNNSTSSLDKKGNNLHSFFDDLDISYDEETKTISLVSKNFTVDGKNGDEILVSETFFKDGKIISMTAKLTIPKGAFKGKLTFDMIFDFDNYSLELYPSPFTFDKPVLLDLRYSGVNFNEFSGDALFFNYLDGESESIKYKSIEIDEQRGLLRIEGAELHHFSRYGWTRTRI